MASYECSGSVTVSNNGKSLTCSGTWSTVATTSGTVQFTGELFEAGQFSTAVSGVLSLVSVIFALWAIGRAFRI